MWHDAKEGDILLIPHEKGRFIQRVFEDGSRKFIKGTKVKPLLIEGDETEKSGYRGGLGECIRRPRIHRPKRDNRMA